MKLKIALSLTAAMIATPDVAPPACVYGAQPVSTW